MLKIIYTPISQDFKGLVPLKTIPLKENLEQIFKELERIKNRAKINKQKIKECCKNKPFKKGPVEETAYFKKVVGWVYRYYHRKNIVPTPDEVRERVQRYKSVKKYTPDELTTLIKAILAKF